MKVEVVAREVGEHDGVELDAGAAVEGQGVRGDLERARLVAGVDHLAEHALQVERLGGRELHGSARSPPMRLTTVPSRPLGRPAAAIDAGHEVGRRRLAVGAGDARARAGRATGRPYQRAAMSAMARRTDGTMTCGDRRAGVALADQRAGAGGDGRRGEGVAVDAEPGDAKEKRAVGDVTRVVGEAPDDGGRVAAHRGAGDPAGPARQAPSPRILSDPSATASAAPPPPAGHGAISRCCSAKRMIFCTAGAAMSPP